MRFGVWRGKLLKTKIVRPQMAEIKKYLASPRQRRALPLSRRCFERVDKLSQSTSQLPFLIVTGEELRHLDACVQFAEPLRAGTGVRAESRNPRMRRSCSRVRW